MHDMRTKAVAVAIAERDLAFLLEQVIPTFRDAVAERQAALHAVATISGDVATVLEVARCEAQLVAADDVAMTLAADHPRVIGQTA